jgi:hypothetical protein
MRRDMLVTPTTTEKKTTLGWVVDGGRRHAGQQEELIRRGHGVEKSVPSYATLAHPGLRLNTFTLSCAESSV